MIENVSPKKFLGQHFLIDENISKKIVNSVILKEFDKIVEIGPGKGALSNARNSLLYFTQCTVLYSMAFSYCYFYINTFAIKMQ